jgi:hypothetical protein
VSSWLIAIFGFGYLAVSIDQMMKGNPAMAITYLGYSIGNVGLYFLAE